MVITMQFLCVEPRNSFFFIAECTHLDHEMGTFSNVPMQKVHEKRWMSFMMERAYPAYETQRAA